MNVSSISNFMDQQTNYTFNIKLVGESGGVPRATTSQCSRTTQSLKALGIQVTYLISNLLPIHRPSNLNSTISRSTMSSHLLYLIQTPYPLPLPYMPTLQGNEIDATSPPKTYIRYVSHLSYISNTILLIHRRCGSNHPHLNPTKLTNRKHI